MKSDHDPSRAVAHWPPYLTARRAIAYTGRSRTTINRAVAAGELAIYGRPGGERGERVFERAELDRWLRGPVTAPVTPAAPRLTRPRAEPIDAIERIRRAARGRSGGGP